MELALLEICVATRQIPSILWNLKIQCRIHKGSPLVPIPSVGAIHGILPHVANIDNHSVTVLISWLLDCKQTAWDSTLDDGRMTETCCGNNIGRGKEELLRWRTHKRFVKFKNVSNIWRVWANLWYAART
jgi:hypothetical protein